MLGRNVFDAWQVRAHTRNCNTVSTNKNLHNMIQRIHHNIFSDFTLLNKRKTDTSSKTHSERNSSRSVTNLHRALPLSLDIAFAYLHRARLVVGFLSFAFRLSLARAIHRARLFLVLSEGQRRDMSHHILFGLLTIQIAALDVRNVVGYIHICADVLDGLVGDVLSVVGSEIAEVALEGVDRRSRPRGGGGGGFGF